MLRRILSVAVIAVMLLSLIAVIPVSAEKADNTFAVNQSVVDESITVNFEIPLSGEYRIGFSYKAIDEATSNLVFVIKIDGEYPFDNA